MTYPQIVGSSCILTYAFDHVSRIQVSVDTLAVYLYHLDFPTIYVSSGSSPNLVKASPL